MAVRSRKRVFCRLLIIAIPTLIILLVCLPSARDNSNFLFISNQHVNHKDKERPDFQDYQLEDFPTVNANSKTLIRRNILVVAHGRSGSTITGDIFNQHPSVFYLHEPLQTVERLIQTAGKSYSSLMSDVLADVFHCNFSKSVVEDFDYFYRNPSHPRGSNALGSPPLCPYEITDPRWAPNLCPPLTSESLGSVCRNKYQVNVAKILLGRVAEKNIKNILAACNPADVDCKIVFLIRDPRAVIPSARSVSFFKDPVSDTGRRHLRRFCYENCKQTEENLAFVKSLPLFWRDRIMIQRYEDFAVDPLKGLSRLYNFAGLPVIDNVRTWLNKSTHPSNSEEPSLCIGNHPAFCTVDDASEAVNRWRWRVHPFDVDIIEHYCKHVMWLMGYKPVDGSYELMSNITVPLFTEDYEAKRWFKD